MVYSFLDLALVTNDSDITATLAKTVATAQKAEQLGFTRFWLAEHHNTPSVASSATTILITHVANHTQTIRIGSGGIMLPNHSPLAIAEAFGTMAHLFNHRIDMGLGRAPGTDQMTAQFLRPDFRQNVIDFPKNVQIIQQLLSNNNTASLIRAFPGEGTEVPIYLLGSSLNSAKLAAALGLPYAFAAHFAPQQMATAFDIYTKNFSPSAQLQQPYKIACVNIIAQHDEEKAQYEATTMYQMFLNVLSNSRSAVAPPNTNWKENCGEQEWQLLQNMLSCSFIGNPASIQKDLQTFIQQHNLQEIMMTAPLYSQAAKWESMECFADIMKNTP
jgi:luciferase family oxidoreductase group 1